MNGAGDSNAWPAWGSLEMWQLAAAAGRRLEEGQRDQAGRGRGCLWAQRLTAPRPWLSRAATLQSSHAATQQATILAEEPGRLPDGQNSWLPGENSWLGPSFLKTRAEPQRTAPHLGSWERRAWPRARGWSFGVGWVLGGTLGDEGQIPGAKAGAMLGLSRVVTPAGI